MITWFFLGNLRDFTDAFLDKQQNVEEDELSRSFYENIMMFLPDAINTVAVLMRWVLLYITLHQDVQHKMHEELYTNIGHGLKVCTCTLRTQSRLFKCLDCFHSTTKSVHCVSHVTLSYLRALWFAYLDTNMKLKDHLDISLFWMFSLLVKIEYRDS